MAFLQEKNLPAWQERVEPEDWFLWQAFHHLRGSRGFNGAIPFSEIAAYCDWVGLDDPVQRGRLATVVIALDNAEREHGRSKANT